VQNFPTDPLLGLNRVPHWMQFVSGDFAVALMTDFTLDGFFSVVKIDL
jgi:hypothetical protein